MGRRRSMGRRGSMRCGESTRRGGQMRRGRRARSITSSGNATLATVGTKRRVRVLRVIGGRRLVQRLAALGIVPGVYVTVDRSSGPALVSVGHTRIAVGRGAARAVEVEEETA